MLKTQKKEIVESEMKELTAPYQNDKLEFIKNPVVAEFLGFPQNTDFTESDLEKSILSNLQKFLMDLGKGVCFCDKAATYSYGERRLLYRSCILQLHTEMFCSCRLENGEDNTSRCRSDGYVYSYV